METNFSLTHEKYVKKNKVLAKLGAFSGMALQEWHKNTVWSQMIKFHAPTEWLDYGCGPAYAYQHEGRTAYDIAMRTESTFTLYDPCHEPYTTFPTQENYAGVMCVDVIEHIPETDTKATLDYLFGVCTDWMFLFISTKRLARSFEDESGNTHCTLKTRDDWVSIVSEYADSCGYPVVLATDYHNDTFDHNGKHMTYDDWNMPAELQQQIKAAREQFISYSPEIAEMLPWELTDSVFRV